MGVDGWYNEPGMKGMVGAHVCCSSCMFGIWKDGGCCWLFVVFHNALSIAANWTRLQFIVGHGPIKVGDC